MSFINTVLGLDLIRASVLFVVSRFFVWNTKWFTSPLTHAKQGRSPPQRAEIATLSRLDADAVVWW